MLRLKFLPAFIFVISSGSFGQTNEDYDFINSIIPQLKIQDPYMLQEQTYPCDFVSEVQFKAYYEELRGKIDSLNFRQMFENSEKNFVPARWRQSYFTEKVTLINVQQVDSLQKANKVSGNVKSSYVISLPVFNDAKDYAAIDFGYGPARNKMAGAHYLFKKKKGKWVLISTFGKWAA